MSNPWITNLQTCQYLRYAVVSAIRFVHTSTVVQSDIDSAARK
jgi:hypothetical protein